ncbi:cryptochrome-1-like isoform X2 [Mercenaria mercenaria]|uniref:cryptochrome-1-like isoform X2 n=1 Tax=Mercenaria mercenaria TaxID=6596 RepID=UPI00234F0C7D|nr:cryptochrome-1-like isoform X2 [Mercenaria mercenaria]
MQVTSLLNGLAICSLLRNRKIWTGFQEQISSLIEMTHRSIHWFRKGLRLHDNPALLEACKNASHVWPVFVMDPWFAETARVGVNRWRFLLQTLQNLDDNLKKINSRLFVVRGNPSDIFPKLFKEWGITKLTYEVDTEPYAIERDSVIDGLAKDSGIEVMRCVSHTLYDTERTISKNGGSPPLTYQRFQTLMSQMGDPVKPVTVPDDLIKGCKTPVDKDYEKKYGVPTLEELGKSAKDCGPCLFPGGETEALERLDSLLKKTNWVCNFEKPKTEPNTLKPSTTVLSPYLKFGCLSARMFYHRVNEVYKGKKHSQPPTSLLGQVMWREFYYTVAVGTPNFDKMVGNSVCTQGRTGYPFIDAVMTQLREEGWIHHLGRHAVACFLTRGDLWISWEEGMNVFEEYLLDADWSLNAGNWMWLSASAFFHQYFRVYSPVAFGKKTDKNGDYIRKYIPKLAKFPEKYIYEPWNAPKAVQEKCGCVIGKDYPKPIVDHDVARKTNISRMAAAYARRKAGKESNGAASTPATKKRKAESDASGKA